MKFYAGSQISRAYIELTDAYDQLVSDVAGIEAIVSLGRIYGELAKPPEFTGGNAIFTTTFPFIADTEEVFYNQVKMTRGVDYSAVETTGTITFTFNPDPTLNNPDTTPLTFNYTKA